MQTNSNITQRWKKKERGYFSYICGWVEKHLLLFWHKNILTFIMNWNTLRWGASDCFLERFDWWSSEIWLASALTSLLFSKCYSVTKEVTQWPNKWLNDQRSDSMTKRSDSMQCTVVLSTIFFQILTPNFPPRQWVEQGQASEASDWKANLQSFCFVVLGK